MKGLLGRVKSCDISCNIVSYYGDSNMKTGLVGSPNYCVVMTGDDKITYPLHTPIVCVV